MKVSVIIPAAGQASRMRPLSSFTSKAMLPVNGQPIISYILNQIINKSEIEEIVIVESPTSTDISNFCKQKFPSSKISFCKQETPAGPLHAIKIGFDNLKCKDSSILVWLGDTIYLGDIPFIEKDYVVVSPVEDKWRWCLVDKSGNYFDKPERDVPTDLALVGVYYFGDRPSFDADIEIAMQLPKIKNEYQISSLLECRSNRFSLVETNEWYDCGELNTYYQSKARLLTRSSRSFNKITVDTFKGIITKSASGDYALKIQREKEWFLKLNPVQSLFTPQLIPSQFGELVMRWEPGIPLNEMWLYENMHADTWKQIYDKIFKIYHEIIYEPVTELNQEHYKAIFEMYIQKNLERISTYSFPEQEIKTVKKFIVDSASSLFSTVKWSNVIHGDLHLGNILFNPINGDIKLIDPRGQFGHLVGTAGDSQYDMAKILHDWYVGYMMILEDRCAEDEIKWNGDFEKRQSILNYIICKMEQLGYNVKNVKKLAIILVLTCIPFHQDNLARVKIFWDHSLKLIEEF